MGDVKLAAFLGAWLGTPVIIALFAGSILAVIPAIVILAMHGRAGRKVGIPFAPFLAGGGVVALFFGDALMDAWLG
jgi:leader peptidase (prepilin peptidase)/N-methyltransferase